MIGALKEELEIARRRLESPFNNGVSDRSVNSGMDLEDNAPP